MADNFDFTKALDDRAIRIFGPKWYSNGFGAVVELVDATYDAPHSIYGPDIPLIIQEFPNDSDLTPAITYDEKHTWSASVTQSLTQRFTMSQSLTLKVPLPFPLPDDSSAEAKSANEFEITKSDTSKKDFTHELHLVYNIQKTNPWTLYTLTITVAEIIYTVPFRNRVQLTGKVDFSTPAFPGPDPHNLLGVGEVFSRFPDEKITVTGSDSVSLIIAGTLKGQFGKKIVYSLKKSKLPK